MRSLSIALFIALALFAQRAQGSQCEAEYVPHEIFYAGGSKTITTDGNRQMSVKSYSIDCPTFYFTPTGLNYAGSTAATFNVSLQSEPEICSASVSGETTSFDSFQAMVVRTPGWAMQPRRFKVMDIDAHLDGSVSWKEVVGVFGVYNGELVAPSVSVAADSVLSVGDGKLTAADMAKLELAAVDATFPAARYAAPGHHDCPLSDTSRCDAWFDFNAPIDTLVLVLSAFDKQIDANYARPGNMSGVLTGPIVSECGCRCTLRNLGVRSVHVPAGTPGECSKKTSDKPVSQCDDEGLNWCAKRVVTGWQSKGELLPNGNLKCTPVERTYAKYLSSYDP